jgi:hypothetical protein
MSPLVIAAIMFVSMVGGALGGMRLRARLPDHHISKETEEIVRLTAGTVATLTALTLGLLIASAKTAFDTKEGELTQFAADLVLIDRRLSHYGPETKAARSLLRRYAVSKIETMWPQESTDPVHAADHWSLMETMQDELRALTPANDAQGWLRGKTLDTIADMAQTHWLLDVQRGSSVAGPFVLVLVLWLVIMFVSFGLFAPRNATASVALIVCSLSIAGAIFLILEMDQPLEGLVYFSSAPMREALAQLGR